MENSDKLSWTAATLKEITGWYMGMIDAKTIDVQSARKRLDFFAGLNSRVDGVAVQQDAIAGFPAEWHTPDATETDAILLYLHGGAYVMGSCKSHRKLVSHIAKAAGMRALVPEYRLAPEHKFPAAIDDAVSIYRALLDQGHEAADIYVAGDSAGGGLCMAMLQRLRDENIAMPAAVVLMSPWADLAGTGESLQSRFESDPWFDPADLATAAEKYCAREDLSNSLVSSVNAEMSEFPPMLIQVGDHEILLSDSQRIADNMRAAGREVELQIWPKMWHVWQMFVGMMPESQQAIDAIGEYLRVHYQRAR